MGQFKRQLLTWGAIVTTTAVLPGLAVADNVSPEHGGGRHGRGHRHDDNAKLAVSGRAVSRGTPDSYGLQIQGRSGEQPTDAGGMIRFAHRGENVIEGLVGEITCLSKDSAGIVAVTGTIIRSGKRDAKDSKGDNGDKGTALLDELAPSETGDEAELAEPARHGGRDGKGERGERGKRRGGGELAGKDFAFTIDVAGKPQKFSTPKIGDAGTLAACSGGGDSVEVTRGRFRTREADAKSDGKDNKDDRGDHRHGRRWWRD
jgi:hypothetical protein